MNNKLATQKINSASAYQAAFLASIKKPSRERYGKALKQFIEWQQQAGAMPKNQSLFSSYIQKYIDARSKDHKATTINAELSMLRAFIKYLNGSFPELNLKVEAKNLKVGDQFVKETLDPEHIIEALDFPEENIIDVRDKALIATLYGTAIRTHSLVNIRIEDIGNRNKHGLRVLKIMRKGHGTQKDKDIYLSDEVYSFIDRYLLMRGKPREGYLFISHSDRGARHNDKAILSTRGVRYICDKRLRAKGLKTKNISAHSLRHSAAVRALQEGADVYDVKEWLGHSSLRITERYLRKFKRENRPAERLITIGKKD